MAKNLVQKILEAHLVSEKGEWTPGKEIAIRIDQTLTQDATGTMAYLQFEAMGVPQVKTELSVSYVDHNTLQSGFENADDHRFLQTVAAKHGIHFSRPGNGICHQVHLERFAKPGKTLLGSDSHTPTAGGMGSIAIGAGGLDIAVAMAGGAFYLNTPKVVKVELKGKLQPWVAAKDIILEVLRIMTVKGGVGKIVEYTGEGVASLTVPERATITNMGAELGATTSIFPSDENTRVYLEAQGRGADYTALAADPDATYDEEIIIDLNTLAPNIAQPHSPDNVAPVPELSGQKIPVNQVAVGSCTNSSYVDLMRLAAVLKGKTVHPNVSLVVSPGSKQVFEMIARNGALADILASGARILESACGPCIGMGQAPSSGAVSVRSFNRNFEGRSGTADAKVYLASVETCAAAAVTGYIADPRELGDLPSVEMPNQYLIDDRLVLAPSEQPDSVDVVRGPNIKPLPVNTELAEALTAPVSLKVGDNITTDHIMPAGAKVLPLRSNIPAISEHVYVRVDPNFPSRAKELGKSVIVGGHNYGQGSSREHAALAPMYLGVKAVIVKSYARIHRANLINFGLLPLTFVNEADYDAIEQGDEIAIDNLRDQILAGNELTAKNVTKGTEFKVTHDLTGRQIDIILAGGLLNYTKSQAV
ncbi:aconitase [Tumebacillus sp. BK434]|uniref:aconitate hydratase n=1 Tax=Tumebacillus sp. BK434 TaxID=2512169 RepID=UPI0010489DE8|nr:aconitate hydratase [Tumebacillus sp. BK434]TCP53795.1 aconitase [Tumebacillus sp. BK434]